MQQFVCEQDGCDQAAVIEWRTFDRYALDDDMETYYTYRCLAHPETDRDYEMRVIDES